MDRFSSLLLLAEEAAQQQPAAEGERPWFFDLIPMIVIIVLGYFMLVRPMQDKQEQLKRLQGVKETDRVITSGGIYGVVTNVQPDSGRVTLRVDDATGTKIKVAIASIAQILGDDDAGSKD